MGKFRKKPVVFDAIQWTGNGDFELSIFLGENNWKYKKATFLWPEELVISTQGGEVTASIGDWIIKSVQGEFCTCNPDIFEKTYEPVVKGEG